jgi:NTE family protein
MRITTADLKIGLALGSGSSRGWSHIGIINALTELGIEPDVICGTSVGAMVGGAYITGNLEKLENWSLSVTKFDVARFLKFNASLTGFVNVNRFHQFLNDNVADDDAVIEHQSRIFAAISTDLETGREVWLTSGSLLQAIWASMSFPGLFPAIRFDDRWLVDGGLVNPVPVSACRALGADIVIAVNLNTNISAIRPDKSKGIKLRNSHGFANRVSELVKEYAKISIFNPKDDQQPPSMLDAIADSVKITQDRITRSRMAGDPPEILLSPRLSDISLLELYRAEEAIAEGYQCVQKMRSEIEDLLGSEF